MRDKESEKLAVKIVSELMKVRKDKGMSHEKLAEMTGLSRATISFVENNKRNPTLITCLKIAKALDVDFDKIIKKSSR
jgi:DNA-binding XRE family transcriptional regulator